VAAEAGREGAAGAAAEVLTATAIAIETVAAVAAEAEIPARVAGSRPRIIETVPGSLANLAGNAQLIL
jgi:hypothetical protein